MAEFERVVGDTAVHFSGVPARLRPPLDVPIDTDPFRAIERVVRERDPSASEPVCDALRGEPRFGLLLKWMGLPMNN